MHTQYNEANFPIFSSFFESVFTLVWMEHTFGTYLENTCEFTALKTADH